MSGRVLKRRWKRGDHDRSEAAHPYKFPEVELGLVYFDFYPFLLKLKLLGAYLIGVSGGNSFRYRLGWRLGDGAVRRVRFRPRGRFSGRCRLLGRPDVSFV